MLKMERLTFWAFMKVKLYLATQICARIRIYVHMNLLLQHSTTRAKVAIKEVGRAGPLLK